MHKTKIYTENIFSVAKSIENLEDYNVTIFTSTVNSQLIENLIPNCNSKNITIYTEFSLKNFATNQSSLTVIEQLLDMGISVRHITGIKSNLIILDDDIIIIGSNQTSEINLSYLTNGFSKHNDINRNVSDWKRKSFPIAIEATNYVREHLAQIDKELQNYTTLIKSLDIYPVDIDKIKKIDEEIENIRREIEPFFSDDFEFLSRNEARDLISSSAWWYKHPSGPCRASGDSSRVYKTGSLWEIKLGANGLNITGAVRKCLKSILREIENVNLSNNTGILFRLGNSLKYDILGSVINYDGDEYEGYYSGLENGHILFGSHSIKIRDFIYAVYDLAEITESLKIIESI